MKENELNWTEPQWTRVYIPMDVVLTVHELTEHQPS